MKKTIEIEGMMCQHCQAFVKKALDAVEGVEATDVDLSAGKATVTLAVDVADDVLTSAVTDAGYKVTGIA